MEGKDPAEVYVDLSCLEPAPFALFLEISDQINREIMPHEYVFTASDGLKEKATYADRGLYSEGVMYLLLNGTLSIDHGKLTGKRR
ncbi:MAG: hypothetical protein KKE49_03450 [Proteobacteria bacterium]|nr:hypothetical protein [Pseudomonadota bacterium]